MRSVWLPLTLLFILVVSLPVVWFWQPAGDPEQGDQPQDAGLETTTAQIQDHDADRRAAQHRELGLAAEPVGGDFALISDAGPVRLSDFRDKLVLIYFGYTWCPDICPTNLAILSLALKQLTPAEREQVQVLFISVDPERDTPQRLAEFAEYFAPEILGLTGAPETLAQVAANYGAAYRRVEQSDSAMGYMIDHSSYSYLVDQRGDLVETLPHATPSEQVVAVIREYLD